jgi:hypothetical protein
VDSLLNIAIVFILRCGGLTSVPSPLIKAFSRSGFMDFICVSLSNPNSIKKESGSGSGECGNNAYHDTSVIFKVLTRIYLGHQVPSSND